MPKMDIDILRQGYRNILHQIYSPKLYYERITTFLREYKPARLRVHLDPQYLLALGRSIYQLGIKGAERVYYWRLWLWTLFHRPRLFPRAIELAIYGYHFRRVVILSDCKEAKNLCFIAGSAVYKRDRPDERLAERKPE